MNRNVITEHSSFTKKFAIGLFVAVMALLTASCSDDEPVDGFLFTEMATLDTADRNIGSTFTVYPPGSLKPVKLTARQLLDEDYVKPGDRVMITYRQKDDNQYSSGEVTLTSYRTVANIVVENLSSVDGQLPESLPFNVKSAWLTGPWLNVRALVPYSPGKVSVRALAAVSGDVADVYLILERSDDVATFEREQYLSMSVADLISPSVTAVTLHVYCPSNPTVETIVMNYPLQR